jgi:hypothetical protein
VPVGNAGVQVVTLSQVESLELLPGELLVLPHALLFGSVPFARNMYYLLNLLSNFTPNNSNMLKPLNGNLFSCKN